MKFFAACCIAYFSSVYAASIDDAQSLMQQSFVEAAATKLMELPAKLGDKVKSSWREKRKQDIENWEHDSRKRYRAEVAVHEAKEEQRASTREGRHRRKAEEKAKVEERKQKREETMKQFEAQVKA
uniref:Uncharacterized protein n=1 Tax=Alexandrium catenella TaxID=2925 RepID=A0A7S1QXL8_ALECA